MMFVFLFFVVVLSPLAWLWVRGIDYMQENHPDYKGDDLIQNFFMKLSLDNVETIVVEGTGIIVKYSDGTSLTVNSSYKECITFEKGFVGGSDAPIIDHCI